MKINTMILERVLAAGYAGAAALLPLLIEQHVISAMVGTDIGVAVAAVATGWHTHTVIAASAAKQAAAVEAAPAPPDILTGPSHATALLAELGLDPMGQPLPIAVGGTGTVIGPPPPASIPAAP
jgi:hypothetical protein